MLSDFSPDDFWSMAAEIEDLIGSTYPSHLAPDLEGDVTFLKNYAQHLKGIDLRTYASNAIYNDDKIKFPDWLKKILSEPLDEMPLMINSTYIPKAAIARWRIRNAK
jgi:hypothetical protein